METRSGSAAPPPHPDGFWNRSTSQSQISESYHPISESVKDEGFRRKPLYKPRPQQLCLSLCHDGVHRGCPRSRKQVSSTPIGLLPLFKRSSRDPGSHQSKRLTNCLKYGNKNGRLNCESFVRQRKPGLCPASKFCQAIVKITCFQKLFRFVLMLFEKSFIIFPRLQTDSTATFQRSNLKFFTFNTTPEPTAIELVRIAEVRSRKRV